MPPDTERDDNESLFETVSMMISLTCFGVRSGLADHNSATIPVTTGVANDVPSAMVKPNERRVFEVEYEI